MDTIDVKDRDQLADYLARLIADCERYGEMQKPSRDRALHYYDGRMPDLVPDEGRSASVSKDVRATVKKIMPSVMRTILSNDKIVEYEPVEQDDVAGAAQATEYVNQVIIPRCGAEAAIHDAIMDALLVKTGILKWVAYHRRQVKVYDYTDQPSEALLGLEGEPGIEIIERVDYAETDPERLAQDPEAMRHDFKLRRIEAGIDIRLEAIPRGSFLIHPGSTRIEDSPVVGERQIVTRSELVSRGYDRAVVEGISVYDSTDSRDGDDREARLGEDWSDSKTQPAKAMEEVLVYEVYAKLDLDGDGIAERYKACVAERSDAGSLNHTLLSLTMVDEAPYAEVVAERSAHEFEGHSLAEDVVDIQRVKTALLRETLDNIYWQNKKQPAIDPSRLTESGLEAVYNPAFGKPITIKPGVSVNEAIQWSEVPFIADRSFAMMEYLDDVIRDRTGLNEMSSGVDPSVFQEVTATSANLISESGIAQAEMAIRSLTRGGIRKAFRGLLRLVIAHTGAAQTVRLRGQWATYDPRYWNADMDCKVNVGLGAGSRERDLSVLKMILGLQKELLSTMGADNPYVKPQQLYNVLEKIVETSGFPSAEPYFTQPDEREMAAKLAQAANQPSEETQKVQLQMQLEQQKAQARLQIEAAQMQADLQVRAADRERESQLQLLKAQQARELAMMQGEIDLLKHREKMQLERQKLGARQATPRYDTAIDIDEDIHRHDAR